MPPYTGLTLLPVLPKDEPNAGRVIINDNFTKIKNILENLQLEAASANTIVSAGTNIDVVFLGFSGGATPIYQVATLNDTFFNTVSATTYYSGYTPLSDIIYSATAWDFSGNNIYNKNAGNVGINNSDPQYKLDAHGDFYNYFSYSNIENTIENNSNFNLLFQSFYVPSSTYSYLNINYNNSTLVTAGGSSTSFFDSFSNLLRLRVNDGIRNLDFNVDLNEFQFVNDIDTLMTVQDDGKVGIGTNLTPQHILHVSGDTLMGNKGYSIFNVDSLPFSSSLSGAGVYYTDGITNTGIFTTDATIFSGTPVSSVFNEDIANGHIRSIEANNSEASMSYKDSSSSVNKNGISVSSAGTTVYGSTVFSADTNMSWVNSGGTVLMELRNEGLALNSSPDKIIVTDNNNILGFVTLSGITNPQVIDYATAQSYASLGLFMAGAYYQITGVDTNLYGGTDVILLAITNNALSSQGYGLFYNPKYNKSINGSGIWTNWNELTLTNEVGNFIPGESIKSDNNATGVLSIGGTVSYFVSTGGIWSAATAITGFTSQATADISSSQLISYNIGDRVIWGGKHWDNRTGSVGSSVDLLNLDSTNWSAVTYNTVDYNLVVDEIEFDFDNNLITKRVESGANNIVTTSLENILYWSGTGFSYPNPIQVFQWGNGYDYNLNIGIGNQLIDSAYNENINFNGTKQVNFNFKPLSYQKSVYVAWNNLNYIQSQSFFNFGYGAYQEEVKLGAGATQANISLEGGANQYFIMLSNNAYQNDFSFSKNSSQTGVVLLNGSNQKDFVLSQSSAQRNFTLEPGFSQSGLNLIGFDWDRLSIFVSTSESAVNWFGSPVKIADGTEADGYVLKSDADGLASWQPFTIYSFSSTTTNNDTEKVIDTITTLPDNANTFLVSYVTAYLDNANYGFWRRTLALNKVSGSLVVVGQNSEFDYFSSGLTSTSVAYSGNSGNLEIRVTGELAQTYTWESKWDII